VVDLHLRTKHRQLCPDEHLPRLIFRKQLTTNQIRSESLTHVLYTKTQLQSPLIWDSWQTPQLVLTDVNDPSFVEYPCSLSEVLQEAYREGDFFFRKCGRLPFLPRSDPLVELYPWFTNSIIGWAHEIKQLMDQWRLEHPGSEHYCRYKSGMDT
jgi:hypothetical protein